MRIIAHRKRDQGYQWLNLLKIYPHHEVERQPTSYMFDADGIITDKFHKYIKEHVLVPNLHWSSIQS